MKIRRKRRFAVVAAPLLVVLAAATAAAGSGPDHGGNYTERRTHTGPDGASVTETTSCTDDEGDVYYERHTRRANADGEDTHSRRSGNPAACAGSRPDRSERSDAPASLVTVNAPVRVDGVSVLGLGEGAR